MNPRSFDTQQLDLLLPHRQSQAQYATADTGFDTLHAHGYGAKQGYGTNVDRSNAGGSMVIPHQNISQDTVPFNMFIDEIEGLLGKINQLER